MKSTVFVRIEFKNSGNKVLFRYLFVVIERNNGRILGNNKKIKKPPVIRERNVVQYLCKIINPKFVAMSRVYYVTYYYYDLPYYLYGDRMMQLKYNIICLSCPELERNTFTLMPIVRYKHRCTLYGSNLVNPRVKRLK